MKISILLPYKENFSPEYPGAVSLFVYETSRISKFKKNITVFGNTNFKKIFNLKYVNINTKKEFFYSQTKNYVNDFVKLDKISLDFGHNAKHHRLVLGLFFDCLSTRRAKKKIAGICQNLPKFKIRRLQPTGYSRHRTICPMLPTAVVIS